jgi:hypothetical protein
MKYGKKSSNSDSKLGLTDDDVVGIAIGLGVIGLIVAASRGVSDYTRGYDDGQRDMLSRTLFVKSN